MNKRPKGLLALSVILVVAALSLPIQVAVIYGHNLLDTDLVFHKLTGLNLLLMFLMFANAYLIYRASVHSLLMSFSLIALVLVNNIYVGHYGEQFSMASTMFASVAFAVVHGTLFLPKTLEVILHPEKRWWNSATRQKVSVPISVSPWVGDAYVSQIFDLSESGAFITSPDQSLQDETLLLGVDDYIELKFNIGVLRQIKCQAQIIRRNNSSTTYPSGLGVKFTDIDKKDKKFLREFVSSDQMRKELMTSA